MEETITKNRDSYISLLQSTGRAGWEKVISYLDSHHFFDHAHCSGHDRYPGGTTNHCLWTLDFALETRNDIMKKRPGFFIPEDSVVIACLLHDVCDCNPKAGTHGGRSREILENRIKGVTFTEEELCAVASHMHNSLQKGGPASRPSSGSLREVLHYIVHNSDHRAIEYAGGIPYGKEPTRTISPRYPEIDTQAYVRFDQQRNCYWWDTSNGGIQWGDNPKLQDMPAFQATIKAHLFIREHPLEADFSILEDNQGKLGLFVVRRFSGMGMPTLMASGKAGFNFTKFIVYFSRFPKYRSSYIACRNIDGKWGVISARDQFSDNNGYPIGLTGMVDYVYDDADSAISAMIGNTGHLVRVAHTRFYKKAVIE